MDIDHSPAFNFRKHYRGVFKKYFLYVLLAVLIVVNIVIFPDLLNHRDIKLNDMSYLLPSESNNILGGDVAAAKPHNVYNTGIEQFPIGEETDEKKDDSTQNIDNKIPEPLPRNHSYLLLLFLILTALFICFGVYVYNNHETIQKIFGASKSAAMREYIASGYQLLQDI